MTYSLQINSHFWRKESNSLFDYEANDITVSSFNVNKPCLLLSDGNRVTKHNKSLPGKDANYIGSVYLNGDVKGEYKFKIEEEFYSPSADSPVLLPCDNWLIVKHTYSSKDLGYRLKDGNLIKLGKIIFKVKEVCVGRKEGDSSKGPGLDRNVTNNENIANNNEEDLSEVGEASNDRPANLAGNNQPTYSNISHLNMEDQSNDLILNNNAANLNRLLHKTALIHVKSKSKMTVERTIRKTASMSNILCRICLGDDVDDVLLSVCKCIGSVRFIHLGCLRKWLNSKIVTKSFNHLTIYSYRNLVCELCKAPLSDSITIKNKKVNLLDFNVPADGTAQGKDRANYLALECVKEKQDANDKKTAYIIYMKDKATLKVGRSTDSDVRMTDISVSRNHATLEIHNGAIYLKDTNSKFGTHVNLEFDQDIILLPEKPLALQLGRHFLIFQLSKSCLSHLFCSKSFHNFASLEDYNDYFINYEVCKIQASQTNNLIEANVAECDYSKTNLNSSNVEYEADNNKREEDDINHDHIHHDHINHDHIYPDSNLEDKENQNVNLGAENCKQDENDSNLDVDRVNQIHEVSIGNYIKESNYKKVIKEEINLNSFNSPEKEEAFFKFNNRNNTLNNQRYTKGINPKSFNKINSGDRNVNKVNSDRNVARSLNEFGRTNTYTEVNPIISESNKLESVNCPSIKIQDFEKSPVVSPRFTDQP